MMKAQRERERPSVTATIGFAARAEGAGLAYAEVRTPSGKVRVLRVPFSCRPLPALLGRDVSYAAVSAVALELHKRGVERAELAVADEHLPLDLEERRPLPAALTLPYVALRCRLNRFAEAGVVAAGDGGVVRDLTARARAEVLLHVAA